MLIRWTEWNSLKIEIIWEPPVNRRLNIQVSWVEQLISKLLPVLPDNFNLEFKFEVQYLGHTVTSVTMSNSWVNVSLVIYKTPILSTCVPGHNGTAVPSLHGCPHLNKQLHVNFFLREKQLSVEFPELVTGGLVSRTSMSSYSSTSRCFF